MSVKIRALQAQKAEAIKAMRALADKAGAENRDLNAEEQADFDKHAAGVRAVNAAIEREELLAAEEARLAPAAGGAVPNGDAVRTITVTENAAADPRRGFQSFGEFAQAVRNASAGNGRPDQRLLIGASAPGTYGGEGIGTDGGFLVPPQYSNEIFNLSLTDDALLPMTDNIDIDSNSMVFPKDETTPWGTDGVRAYWQAEASAATATKPKFGTATLRMHKLMALVPLTDELVADAGALGAYLPNLLSRSIRWKTNEAILFGTGAGQPQGAFAGAAAVTIAKESGQATLTLQLANISKMIAALPPGSFPRAVWLITPDALPSLFGLTLGNYPIYLPISQGAQGSPYGMLMGRPVLVSQHASAFSAQGDLMLVDLKEYYRTITKAGGIATASSLHLYFDADATAFRSTFRVDGQPKIVAPITQAKGTAKLSPFVQLGAR